MGHEDNATNRLRDVICRIPGTYSFLLRSVGEKEYAVGSMAQNHIGVGFLLLVF